MRFRVQASDGQVVELRAADWMMALVRGVDRMGHRMTGFSCNTRPGGIVDVTDYDSGLTWVVTPLDDHGTPLIAEPRAAVPEPAPATDVPASGRLMQPRRRRYRVPPRMPLWSPDSSPRRGPEPRTVLEQPPPNLKERLFELALEIQKCQEAQAACEKTLELVMGLVPGEAGSVLRGGQDDERLVFVAATGPAGAALLGRELPYGEGIAGAACLAGVTLQVNDVSIDPRHFSGIDLETGFRTRSILCVPVRTEAGFFGVVEVLNPPDGGFLAWHVDVVESLAQALVHTLAGEPPSHGLR